MARSEAQQGQYIGLSRFEAATGWVTGHAGPDPRLAPTSTDPVEALGKAILPALARPPCVVAFSGGRDSSAILAVAMHVARREGLPPPVALTRRWPAYPETDESTWQELVVKSLGLTDWEKVEFEENDVIGPTFSPSLRRLGVLWPPLLHSWPPMFAAARGGAFVTGEGGDEVFGPRRCTWFRRALWGRPTRAVTLGTAISFAPRSVRRAVALRRARREVPGSWLFPEARESYHRLLADEESGEPLHWRASMAWHLRQRALVVGSHNLALLAAESGAALYQPLLDPGFIGSLSVVAGPLGFPGRTRAMRAVFGAFLPEELLARSTKAYTTSLAFGPWSKRFIEGWQGDGAESKFVDPRALQEAWAAESPPVGTMLILQQAWLSTQGLLHD